MTIPSKGQPSVDELLENMLEKYIGREIKFIDTTAVTEAKASLLAHDLSLLPEHLAKAEVLNKYGDLYADLVETSETDFAEGFNAATKLMEQRLREGYENA